MLVNTAFDNHFWNRDQDGEDSVTSCHMWIMLC